MHKVKREHTPLPSILHFAFLAGTILLQLHLWVYHTSSPEAFTLDDFNPLRNGRPLIGKELISLVAIHQGHIGKALEDVRRDTLLFPGNAQRLHLLNELLLKEAMKLAKGSLISLSKALYRRMCADGFVQVYDL